VRTPRGWSYAGLHSGIKAVRKDVALFASEGSCVAAGLFTINGCKAAPILDAEPRLPGDGFRALVVNSGNANALTGRAGLDDVVAIRGAFGKALGVDPGAILTASTGVIGVRLPASKLVAAAPLLRDALGPGIEPAAEAIFTTDTRPKIAHRALVVGGREVVLAACAKGSGMVAPQLATVLAAITTDLAITPRALKAILARAADRSFHEIVIDGEMSTNDALFALANGLAGGAPIDLGDPALPAVEEALSDLCAELARAVVEDGEGATKTIEVEVSGAPSTELARDLAQAVAGSILVKTAVFGADPNWGRVLASIGARLGARARERGGALAVDPLRATVAIQGTTVFAEGEPVAFAAPALRAKMRGPRVAIAIDLAQGAGRGRSLGCDLSYDYVKINADYTATITSSPEGTVSRDDRLTNYTPGFKRALLVEALSYISKFAGRRAVVCVRGDALVKDSLRASFAADINLLDAAGLLPIVVHGGGPEIARTLSRIGASPDDAGLSRSTDPKLVEMVLSGRVNTELVSLLNQETSRAVGISGKDGGLLRARRRASEDPQAPSEWARAGEISSVDHGLLELLLGKEYIPVVAPIALGDDGEGWSLETHAVAAEIAIALRAEKLIFLADAPGILEAGELISELGAGALRQKIEAGVVSGGMLDLARSVLRAIEGGVPRVHVVDGRVPHGVIAELFTDRGVGTLVTP
jgi:acetylglutamate kinase